MCCLLAVLASMSTNVLTVGLIHLAWACVTSGVALLASLTRSDSGSTGVEQNVPIALSLVSSMNCVLWVVELEDVGVS